MCESGKQCPEGESCGARVDQLKRLIWLLMIWVSILSLGLGASIALHIILRQGSSTTVTIPSKPVESTASTRSQLTSYVFDRNINQQHELKLQWRKRDEDQGDTAVKIEEDGNYFLFLRVTLQSQNKGVNYTVTVIKTPEGNNPTNITVGHINATENSTGFIGIGARLSKDTLINVICNPKANFDVDNTYLGLIKF
ncbi:tumor necrosis factor ligand superfamily member 18 [Ictalurus punctatus]|uniref:Tumor necrosis factor ligand superfamily member 18 n=1 Tax=Ictalurus punctatus TaxID=7998 RepID=A0A979EBK9_ICTPU|nr:tumor necrosis factor ligand superfamily member 18 [Ictalurus punctatus]